MAWIFNPNQITGSPLPKVTLIRLLAVPGEIEAGEAGEGVDWGLLSLGICNGSIKSNLWLYAALR